MSTGQQYRPFGAIVLAALSAALCVRVSTATAAQDVTFQTSVDRTSISMGERVSVGFVLSGSRSGNNFQQPDFRDFTVLTGPNTSTGIQMINGSVSSSLTYG